MTKRRWNSWGWETVSYPLPEQATHFLMDKLGGATPLPIASLQEVLASVPESRLEAHPLVDCSAEVRVNHCRGQSLADWLALKSGQLGVIPDGVAMPTTSEQVAELLQWAKQHQYKIIPYGGGTSVAGHITPQASEQPILTLSLVRLNQLIHVDKDSLLATIGAGATGPQVEAQLQSQGYTLGHFPQSFEFSTLGGWIATRSSGQQSLYYGRIEQLFAGGRLETLEGPLNIPAFPASAAGPDLREWVLGSEGRIGVITEAIMRVSPCPSYESFRVVILPSWEQAIALLKKLVQLRLGLSMLRLSDGVETDTHLQLAGHPRSINALRWYLQKRGCGQGMCMLTVGFTGQQKSQYQNKIKLFKQLVAQHKGVSTGEWLGKKWAAGRFRLPYLREALWQRGFLVDTVETAIAWSQINLLKEQLENAVANALVDEGEKIWVFTHVSHCYPQGASLYTTFLFRQADNYTTTYARWQKLKQAACEAIVKVGGTISHHHGVGKDHAPYLKAEKGELGIQQIKNWLTNFDSNQQLNPGTLLPSTLLPSALTPDSDKEDISRLLQDDPTDNQLSLHHDACQQMA
ncbi:FAD-binding oxidoreductase [Spartinivicinus poritis]|uniref:FAD-binding oxidoreductase n=1 Tax=Spartinivicinus poritis TaxID=2994640 RepID=A0ABT5UEU7_9GAMM|nr:FAD-binding oxidoreductase [Spartinivicinus sp. A2-2]MDE1464905.1 FAD-binding oxidoreductase [Spartinivicinus sp. A2-2]